MADILVVDDRAVCRDVLITLLGYAQHHLYEATNGVEALVILKDKHVDLVITDLLMPKMNGYDLVHTIKSDPKIASIPIIFYTASFLLDEAKLLAETCGVDYVLYKPCDPQIIMRVVNQALRISDESPATILNGDQAIPHRESENAKKIAIIDAQLTEHLTKLEALREEISALANNKSAPPKLQKQLSVISKQLSADFFHVKIVSKKILAMFTLGLDVVAEREFKKLSIMFCNRARDIIGSNYCGLGILDNTNHLKHFSLSGVDNDTINKIGIPLRSCDLFNRILNTDDVLIVNYEHVDAPEFHPEIKGLLGSKLVTSSHLYGFIYFANKKNGHKFNADDVQVVSALASELSILYENADLYDEIQRHAAMLQIALNEHTGK